MTKKPSNVLVIKDGVFHTGKKVVSLKECVKLVGYLPSYYMFLKFCFNQLLFDNMLWGYLSTWPMVTDHRKKKRVKLKTKIYHYRREIIEIWNWLGFFILIIVVVAHFVRKMIFRPKYKYKYIQIKEILMNINLFWLTFLANTNTNLFLLAFV